MQPINIYDSQNVKVTIDENGTPVQVTISGCPVYVEFYADFASLPNPGQGGIIYITEDTNYLYRWDGSYVQVGGGSLTWGQITGTLSNQTDLQSALDGKVDENSAITGDTKTKITYDSKGLVTSGADAGISDITGLQTALDSKVDENATITGATKTKITYDSKGLVTSGADAGISDITGLQTALDGKVPYTGATGNVDLGEYGASGGYYQFDVTPTTYTQSVGKMGWNDSEGTIEFLLKGGNVDLTIGEKLVARVVNGTGGNVLKSNYQVVKVTGAQGQRLQVNLAQANNDANSADTLGLIAENISNNQSGFIVTSGLVEEINTTGNLQSETWSDGDPLYLSPTTAGKITNVKPQAPQHTVIIGFVVYAHANHGKIFVKVDNGYELDELHNVRIDTNTLSNGQVLKYNSTLAVWENNTDSAGTGTVTSIATSSPLTGGTITTSGTIGITQATTSSSGYLSSTDWNTFNSKESALTFSSPLSRSVNTISIPVASGSANGYLSSTDWTTFNNKQNALTNPVTGTGTSNELAYFSGTSAISSLSTATYPSLTELSYVKGVTSSIQTQLNGKQATLTNPVTGTGTSGQVSYFNGTSTITGSSNLIWDNANSRLGINTASPAYGLEVTGTAKVSSTFIAANGQWDSTGIATNNIRRLTAATLVINSDGGTANSLNFSSTSSWGSISSGKVNGMYNSMAFTGTGTSSFSVLSTTGAINTASSGSIHIIDIINSITTSNASSFVRGFYYNPTISGGVAGTHRAIETVTGDIYFAQVSGNVAIGTAPTSTSKLTTAGSITASSAIARGVYFNNTLVAAANNDVLVGLDISSTFTNGAFTGVSNYGVRTNTANCQFGTVGAATGTFRIDGVNGAAYAFAVYSSNTLRFGVTGFGGLTSNNNNLDLGTSYLLANQIRLGENVSSNTLSIKNTSVSNNAISIKNNAGVVKFLIPDSGNVLIGTSTDIASSILTLSSTTQGFLPPRMTTTQRDAISTPATGLVIFNTTTTKLETYDGATWQAAW